MRAKILQNGHWAPAPSPFHSTVHPKTWTLWGWSQSPAHHVGCQKPFRGRGDKLVRITQGSNHPGVDRHGGWPGGGGRGGVSTRSAPKKYIGIQNATLKICRHAARTNSLSCKSRAAEESVAIATRDVTCRHGQERVRDRRVISDGRRGQWLGRRKNGARGKRVACRFLTTMWRRRGWQEAFYLQKLPHIPTHVSMYVLLYIWKYAYACVCVVHMCIYAYACVHVCICVYTCFICTHTINNFQQSPNQQNQPSMHACISLVLYILPMYTYLVSNLGSFFLRPEMSPTKSIPPWGACPW